MEAEKPFCRVETDHKYRIYVPKTRPLTELALDLHFEWPLTSGEMYNLMIVFDESITRENSYGKQLYEEAQHNLSDVAYAESKEGQWERAVLCVGKTGRVPHEGKLVPVRVQCVEQGTPFVLVHLNCCDYGQSLKLYMAVEAIIDTFEHLEI